MGNLFRAFFFVICSRQPPRVYLNVETYLADVSAGYQQLCINITTSAIFVSVVISCYVTSNLVIYCYFQLFRDFSRALPLKWCIVFN